MPAPTASGSGAAPLHPPAHPTATPTAGSSHPSGYTYEQRHPVRQYGRSYTDRAPSLLPDAEGAGPTSAPPAPAAPGVGQQEPSAPYGTGHRVRRLLPLGVGLTLVGLGLGFLGLRLRRP